MKFISRLLLKFFLVILCIISFIYVFVIFYPVKNDIDIKSKTVYIVIPGAGITIDGKPDSALKMRLDKAIEIAVDNDVALYILSGRVPEPTVMKNYLVKKKIPETKVYLDNTGKNTLNTIKNLKFINTNENIVFVIVSQKYHIPRIEFFLRKEGINNSYTVAADTKQIGLYDHFIFITREVFALIWYFFRGNLI